MEDHGFVINNLRIFSIVFADLMNGDTVDMTVECSFCFSIKTNVGIDL